MTPTDQPTTPPAPGYYWQYDAGRGWHQVRPMNWASLLVSTARIARQRRAEETRETSA